MLKAHPLNQLHYWGHQISITDHVFQGNFDQKKLTPNSIVIYVGIIDKHKNILRSGWSSHKDVDSALGFLQYVFLPTSYYTWMDRDSDGFYIPLSPFDVLRTEVVKQLDTDNFDVKKDDVRFIRAYNYLSSLWVSNPLHKMDKLKKFSSDFNTIWDQDPNQKLFIKIFNNTDAIVDFILENETYEFEEVIEEEINMTIDELRFICENVYKEPLINRTFIEKLNANIPIWF